MDNKILENSPSILLNNQENEYLFQLLGHKIKCRSTAVVEVYGTTPPHHTNWDYKYCGVATFVKDFSRRSFFIQVYDIEVGKKVYEQEIYEDFYYSVNPLFFHQFESENEIIGLNFASEDEADHFGSAIVKFTERKRLKKALPDANQNQDENNTKYFPRKLKSVKSSRKSKRKLKTRRVSKSEIGIPENFRHIQHVGLDRGGESPTDNLLACFIDLSNIELKEPNIISSEPEVKDEIPSMNVSPPEIPSASKPQKNLKKSFRVKPKINLPELSLVPKLSPKIRRSVSTRERGSVTPPPTGINRSESQHPPTPPPPPPPGMQMKPNLVKQRSEEPSNINEPINKNLKQESADSSSPRTDLLEEIRNPTVRLKHNLKQESADSSYPRTDLLEEIRNPTVRLKHVEVKKEKRSLSSSSNLLNSLAKTLDDRGLAFRGTSDDSDSDSSYSHFEDDDDSDW